MAEKKEKFNEYKLMYDAEVTNLREQYQAEVENAKAQLSLEMQKETETLRGHNEDLVGFSYNNCAIYVERLSSIAQGKHQGCGREIGLTTEEQ